MKNSARFLRDAAILHTVRWMRAHRDKYPLFVFSALWAAAVLVISGVALTVMHPAIGEIIEGVIISAAGYLIAFGAVYFGAIIMQSFRQSAQVVWQDIQARPLIEYKALPASALPGIGSDLLIIPTPGESNAEYAARIEVAVKQSSATMWVVTLSPRHPVVTIYGQETYSFRRDEEIFQGETWKFIRRIAEAGTEFTTETDADFRRYVTEFCRYYREWAPVRKVELSAGAKRNVPLEILRNSVNIILFLLLSVSVVSGQSKTRQVDEALGTRIREIPAAGEKVTFVFREGNRDRYYNRIGDGRSEYTDLLKRAPGIVGFDDQGGELVAVTKGEEVVARAESVERVNISPTSKADQMRPHRALASEEVRDPGRLGISIPDSASGAAMFEDWKRGIRETEQQAGEAAKPAFDFSWWLFGELFLSLFVAASILWFFAKTASEEGIMGIWGETVFISPFLVMVHQNCSAALMVVLWIAEIFIFIKAATLLWYSSIPMAVGCCLWIFGLWAIRKIHNRIVPNIKGLAGAGRGGGSGLMRIQ